MSSKPGRDRKGALPYAAVAITILVLTAAWSAAVYASQKTEDSAETVTEDSTKVSTATENVSAWMERGLGEIIHTVSTSQEGTLEEREKRFYTLTDEWMKTMFPTVDSGIRIEATGWDFTLTSTALQTGSLLSADGYTPSYLSAKGTVDTRLTGESGRTTVTLNVEADAGSALPLAAERGSLFANAITGSGSLLSQLMTYQLSSLAQYRVINGWGSLAYYGDHGTSEIITKEDVKKSYQSSMDAISSLYLRTETDDWNGQVDAASIFLKDQSLEIDLNSVYAQALYGIVDDLVAKWLDYFGGASLINTLEGITDAIASGWNTIVGFITRSDTDSAADYIKKVCGDADYSICKGRKCTFTKDGVSVEVAFPSANVLDLDEVKSFHRNYRDNVNGIREWITGIINEAVTSVAETKALGTLKFTVGNDSSFAEALELNALNAASRSLTSVGDALKCILENKQYTDRMSGTLWRCIEDAKETDLLYSEESFASYWIPRINQVMCDAGGAVMTDEEILESQEFIDSYSQWKSDVDRVLNRLSTLKNVSASNDSIIRTGCLAIVKCGLGLADMCIDVTPKVSEICSEYNTAVSSQGFSGLNDYPSESGFKLVSEDGSSTVWLNLTKTSSPKVSVSLDKSNCMHGTGFKDSTVASFTTSWNIQVKDSLGFTIDCSDSRAGIASFADTVNLTADIHVSTVSGWALMGIDYIPTTTLSQDIMDAALSLLLKFIDPLIDLLKAFQEIMAMLSEVAAKLYGITQTVVDAIYMKLDRVMTAYTFVQETFGQAGCEALMSLVDQIERKYNITLSSQNITLIYGGWSLKLTFYATTLGSYTKHLVKATLSGNVGGADYSGYVDVKVKGTSSYTPVITGGLEGRGEDWDFNAKIDPTMSSESQIVGATGQVRGTEFDLKIPILDQYREIDLSVCDIPAVGTALSNIPFIIPGTLVSLDAGLDIKYDIPVEAGILINEVEANPAGNDRDSEWAEIINLGTSAVDISGWILETAKGKTYTFADGTKLSVGSRIVAEFEGLFLNNTSETLYLKSPDGTVVDKIALKNDSYDDNRTCQRAFDGCTEWGLYAGTQGAMNEGGLFDKNGAIVKVCFNILANAAKKALSELGGKVTTEEGVAELIRLTLKYALDEGINQLSSMLVEASLYIEIEITDLSSAVTFLGFRIHLTADKDMAGDVLKYLVGKVATMVFGLTDPYNIDLGDAIMDDILLGVTFYTGYGVPSLFKTDGSDDVKLGTDISVNLSGVSRAFGSENGSTKIKAGVLVRNIPYAVLPKFLDARKELTSDLWLFKIILRPGGKT